MNIEKYVKEILATKSKFEELTDKKPELFKSDELLQLTDDEMYKLIELSFIDVDAFKLNQGKHVLWIDWMNNKQLDEIAKILLG